MQNVTKDQTPSAPDPAERFASLIQEGILAWTMAGELLVTMLSKDSQCFQKISEKFPHISLDTLRCFERIGRKQLYPPLLADVSTGARRLSEMPYDLQKKYFHEPIEVAVEWKRGVIKTVKKSVNKLTKRDCEVVFGKVSINNLDQQAWRLRKPQEKQLPQRTPLEKPVDIGYFSITCDAEGRVTLAKCSASPIAQPVRVIPSNNGWKSAILVFYRIPG